MNRIDAYVEEAAAPLLVSEPTTVARGIGDRLIASISCASDSGIDTRRLKQLLLIGLALIALFEMAASAFPVLSGDSPKPDPIAFRTFILVLLSVSAISLPRIGRNWRWWTLSFCIILMLSATMLDKDEPVMMLLFVLIITSAVTIPWEARWQSSLGVIALGVFTIAANGDRNDLQQWLILTVMTGLP
jgi:hypothetical protein